MVLADIAPVTVKFPERTRVFGLCSPDEAVKKSRCAEPDVALVPVKKSPKKEEHPLIVKWTPVFMEARKDGIPVVHYRNPITGDNDITMLVFDNRVLQATMPSDNTLSSTMDMAKYHKVVEEMSRQ